MAEKSYNVILQGTIIPARSREDVVKRLSLAFRKDAAFTEKLLSGQPRIIRQNVDLATAEKYRKIIERAGAACRIQQVDETERSLGSDASKWNRTPRGDSPVGVRHDMPLRDHEAVPEQTLSALRSVAQVPPPSAQGGDLAPPLATCPRCGYEATRDDDVMLVRGDCPLCGFMVSRGSPLKEEQGLAEEQEAFSDTDEFSTDPFAGIMPATLPRRALASIYTFSQFLTIYCILVLVALVSFTPLNSVPEQVAKKFLVWACTAYPVVLGVLSVLIVSFVVPMFNEGRSWGQKAFAIEILYTEEVRFGGLALALTFRNVAICLLSFGPALILRWLGYKAVAPDAWLLDTLVMVVLAVIAWSASWLFFLMAGGKRSLLDVAGGTVQTETGLLPPRAVRKALLPLFTILVILIALGTLSVTLEKLKW